MLNLAVLFTFVNLSVLAEDDTGGIPWWGILLILVIITIVVIWALTRSANFSEKDVPHIDHAHAEPAEPAAAAVQAEPAAEAVQAEPVAEPAHAEPVAMVPDDLTRIEGIGPKIASVLNAAGIQTFAQLAEADPEAIKKILHDEDPRLARLGDPRTWPAQARLAAAGDMNGLQAMTEKLKGGRQVE